MPAAKLPSSAIRAARVLYDAGMGADEIAGHIWQRCGYASMASCANSLRRFFREGGQPVRTRGEATSLAIARGRRTSPLNRFECRRASVGHES